MKRTIEINNILEETVIHANEQLHQTFYLANALEIALEQLKDTCETCLRKEWCNRSFKSECFEWEWDGWETLSLRMELDHDDEEDEEE